MMRVTVIAALVLVAPIECSRPRQWQHAVGGRRKARCDDTRKKKAKRSIFGSVLGGIAGGNRRRSTSAAWSSLLPVGSILADELMKLLDCKEQSRRRTLPPKPFGGRRTEVRWQSEKSRQNVSGVSKVTARAATCRWRHCMTVTDVVIIDGEETTVPKRMCRGKGDSGYRKA